MAVHLPVVSSSLEDLSPPFPPSVGGLSRDVDDGTSGVDLDDVASADT